MENLILGKVTESKTKQALGTILYNETEIQTDMEVQKGQNVVFDIQIISKDKDTRAVNVLCLSDCLENLWYFGQKDDQLNILKYTRAVKLFFNSGLVSVITSPNAKKGLDLYLGISNIHKQEPN